MTTTHHQCNEMNAADARRRQLRVAQIIFAGAAAIAMFALFDAARPDATDALVASGSVNLVDQATDLPAPVNGPFGPQYPQTPPSLVGGGFAADDDDDEAQEQAQQQEQLALQEMQQAEQQAEEQEQLANQEAQQAEQQGLQVEQQANQ